ncbi:16S rRNA (cytosine(967)-C(5))-methyltransferase RsmB [Paenibacillus sp. N1-5-1-14]|uniref:16S rRNA (cytosine(967)-C(5))-methyltransferase RsmB n=1 Tax=Paenibacillus radicibacter TaxID=2972488 RepID=UPI002158A986|nr:16S rRNA (cytosine(967)-C(5))-methyltransferase RsmB [Paenibacillus radicibacter]MCR8641711.1 16S rRNA (cytosine(967)-C(5))-methyltransferase RsmB [Paenibacillus radicibacter]
MSHKNNKNHKETRKLTAREVALHVLTGVDQDQAYSNLLLNQTLKDNQLERADVGLATEIVYGTIQRMNTIDYFLERFVAKGLKKLQPWVKSLLRLSFYQLHYLERVPDHAVVSEAVNIAKRRGHAGISGMVNAVLRNIIRSRETLQLPAELPKDQRLALEHSHPLWMVKRWVKQFGADAAERICAANNVPPHVSIRANTLQGSREELLRALTDKDIAATSSPLAPAGVIVTGAGNMALTAEFAAGRYTVQDESSMLVAEVVDPKPGMQVLDCCAAPGGKTTHMAEKMQDQGIVWACDVHEHKEQLIADAAHRLGLNAVRTMITDARELASRFEPETFDRILLDAPCSGLGVIRRKPDLKWAKKESDIKEIAALQRELLEAVQGLLRPGGVLVYSTCTIEKDENEGNVLQFLDKHSNYKLTSIAIENMPKELEAGAKEGMLSINPDLFHSDGFFIAKLVKSQA